ncbi:MAG: 3-hydroxyacyl-CoA dehydrogenase NAD-binding domain-containing protein [Rhodospirillales bacterium]
MRELRKVAVIGGGLIGMSWASLFLARGLEVVVTDPRAAAEAELDAFVAEAWPTLRALELTASEAIGKAAFTTDIASLTGIDFVAECGPDRIAIKRQIVAEIEAVVASDVPISSSTSSLMASDIQDGARHPERILVGHPMNPPHLVPMVELVGGRQTSEEALATAEAFYRRMKRVTIRVRKEVVGHLANRLNSALYREAVNIVAQGIGTVEDVDKAIAYGAGMRWALMGPHMIYHLGGGAGGYRHYLDHLGPTQEARWRDLGTSPLTEDLKNHLVEGLDRELREQDETTLTARRDEALVELYRLKRKFGF